MFSGGFSAGDEPDGSAKFYRFCISEMQRLWKQYMKLLQKRDGLALGICNGFQALIKLGLVPYGADYNLRTADAPTLTMNSNQVVIYLRWYIQRLLVIIEPMACRC